MYLPFPSHRQSSRLSTGLLLFICCQCYCRAYLVASPGRFPQPITSQILWQSRSATVDQAILVLFSKVAGLQSCSSGG
ncbi:hypothetical protein B0T22DRAFT_459236 [Podospora appendiculata]|uniref:Uncharacterized protein n=1 Tax=Podospora appendiculata TaxID=314037 RepID=A0AAE1CCB5_9PEZI|nr:hypothetical protein B0T22DRAFT_459236 [Podospora appendiculata]